MADPNNISPKYLIEPDSSVGSKSTNDNVVTVTNEPPHSKKQRSSTVSGQPLTVTPAVSGKKTRKRLVFDKDDGLCEQNPIVVSSNSGNSVRGGSSPDIFAEVELERQFHKAIKLNKESISEKKDSSSKCLENEKKESEGGATLLSPERDQACNLNEVETPPLDSNDLLELDAYVTLEKNNDQTRCDVSSHGVTMPLIPSETSTSNIICENETTSSLQMLQLYGDDDSNDTTDDLQTSISQEISDVVLVCDESISLDNSPELVVPPALVRTTQILYEDEEEEDTNTNDDLQNYSLTTEELVHDRSLVKCLEHPAPYNISSAAVSLSHKSKMGNVEHEKPDQLLESYTTDDFQKQHENSSKISDEEPAKSPKFCDASTSLVGLPVESLEHHTDGSAPIPWSTSPIFLRKQMKSDDDDEPVDSSLCPDPKRPIVSSQMSDEDLARSALYCDVITPPVRSPIEGVDLTGDIDISLESSSVILKNTKNIADHKTPVQSLESSNLEKHSVVSKITEEEIAETPLYCADSTSSLCLPVECPKEVSDPKIFSNSSPISHRTKKILNDEKKSAMFFEQSNAHDMQKNIFCPEMNNDQLVQCSQNSNENSYNFDPSEFDPSSIEARKSLINMTDEEVERCSLFSGDSDQLSQKSDKDPSREEDTNVSLAAETVTTIKCEEKTTSSSDFAELNKSLELSELDRKLIAKYGITMTDEQVDSCSLFDSDTEDLAQCPPTAYDTRDSTAGFTTSDSQPAKRPKFCDAPTSLVGLPVESLEHRTDGSAPIPWSTSPIFLRKQMKSDDDDEPVDSSLCPDPKRPIVSSQMSDEDLARSALYCDVITPPVRSPIEGVDLTGDIDISLESSSVILKNTKNIADHKTPVQSLESSNLEKHSVVSKITEEESAETPLCRAFSTASICSPVRCLNEISDRIVSLNSSPIADKREEGNLDHEEPVPLLESSIGNDSKEHKSSSNLNDEEPAKSPKFCDALTSLIGLPVESLQQRTDDIASMSLSTSPIFLRKQMTSDDDDEPVDSSLCPDPKRPIVSSQMSDEDLARSALYCDVITPPVRSPIEGVDLTGDIDISLESSSVILKNTKNIADHKTPVQSLESSNLEKHSVVSKITEEESAETPLCRAFSTASICSPVRCLNEILDRIVSLNSSPIADKREEGNVDHEEPTLLLESSIGNDSKKHKSSSNLNDEEQAKSPKFCDASTSLVGLPVESLVHRTDDNASMPLSTSPIFLRKQMKADDDDEPVDSTVCFDPKQPIVSSQMSDEDLANSALYSGIFTPPVRSPVEVAGSNVSDPLSFPLDENQINTEDNKSTLVLGSNVIREESSTVHDIDKLKHTAMHCDVIKPAILLSESPVNNNCSKPLLALNIKAGLPTLSDLTKIKEPVVTSHTKPISLLEKENDHANAAITVRESNEFSQSEQSRDTRNSIALAEDTIEQKLESTQQATPEKQITVEVAENKDFFPIFDLNDVMYEVEVATTEEQICSDQLECCAQNDVKHNDGPMKPHEPAKELLQCNALNKSSERSPSDLAVQGQDQLSLKYPERLEIDEAERLPDEENRPLQTSNANAGRIDSPQKHACFKNSENSAIDTQNESSAQKNSQNEISGKSTNDVHEQTPVLTPAVVRKHILKPVFEELRPEQKPFIEKKRRLEKSFVEETSKVFFDEWELPAVEHEIEIAESAMQSVHRELKTVSQNSNRIKEPSKKTDTKYTARKPGAKNFRKSEPIDAVQPKRARTNEPRINTKRNAIKVIDNLRVGVYTRSKAKQDARAPYSRSFNVLERNLARAVQMFRKVDELFAPLEELLGPDYTPQPLIDSTNQMNILKCKCSDCSSVKNFWPQVKEAYRHITEMNNGLRSDIFDRVYTFATSENCSFEPSAVFMDRLFAFTQRSLNKLNNRTRSCVYYSRVRLLRVFHMELKQRHQYFIDQLYEAVILLHRVRLLAKPDLQFPEGRDQQYQRIIHDVRKSKTCFDENYGRDDSENCELLWGSMLLYGDRRLLPRVSKYGKKTETRVLTSGYDKIRIANPNTNGIEYILEFVYIETTGQLWISCNKECTVFNTCYTSPLVILEDTTCLAFSLDKFIVDMNKELLEHRNKTLRNLTDIYCHIKIVPGAYSRDPYKPENKEDFILSIFLARPASIMKKNFNDLRAPRRRYNLH